MKIEQEILINQYGQEVVDIGRLISLFESLNGNKKREFIDAIIYLIIQSKPKGEDIEPAIIASELKATYTPCILLRKGIENHKLQQIAKLPNNELEKVLILLLNLFKIAYNRRYEREKNNPDKWWYWDLSDGNMIKLIITSYNRDS